MRGIRLALPPWRRWRVPLQGGIVPAVLAACLILLAIEGWSTWEAAASAITADETVTANLARSLAQHAGDTVRTAEVVLGGLRERVETNPPSPEATARLERRIATVLANVPALSGLAVFDARGARLAGEDDPTPGMTAADRACLEYHRTHADRGAHVGDVVASPVDDRSGLAVSLRIDDTRGGFAGIVRARISVAFLRGFYRGFATGRDGVISLTSTRGVLVTRSDTHGSPGADVSSGPVFRKVAAGEDSGSFRYVSPVDGVRRLGSFRRVDGHPLYVVVGHALDEVLAAWRANAWRHLAVGLSVSAVLLLAGVRFAEQARTRQEAERRYRLLADNSSDAIVCIGLDGTRRYASPAFATLTGWSVEEGVGARSVDSIHPEDRAEYARLVGLLVSGTERVTWCFRYIRKDGSTLWAEARARLLESPGEEAQIICNVCEITERRAAEARLEQANRELAVRATTDGLTGLANRRHLDEILDQEWRRAARDEMPLSLLMVDVDRFKAFNDSHGHQRGDECLRAVAATMAQAARRPADLVARYGGEEFAVLLPGVDEAGALATAERMLDAIRALGIGHAANPGGVVTASIGVACVLPCADRENESVAALVARADGALYRAKRSGRDRAVVSESPAAVIASALVREAGLHEAGLRA